MRNGNSCSGSQQPIRKTATMDTSDTYRNNNLKVGSSETLQRHQWSTADSNIGSGDTNESKNYPGLVNRHAGDKWIQSANSVD